MKTYIVTILVLLVVSTAVLLAVWRGKGLSLDLTEGGVVPPLEAFIPAVIDDPWGLIGWKRPVGPLRFGIQAGHWKYTEAPDELEGVRNNGGGTSATGVPEWKVNLAVAEKIAERLRAEGIEVDILPATIPPGYWADAFISLHADGNDSTAVSGYKVAAARRDITGKADTLARLIEAAYGPATGLALDPNVTRTMRGYYAFNWRRYEHAIHPMVPGVIVEMGFLSNPSDARLLINTPDRLAKPIAEAMSAFLTASREGE
jgi:N-acetylmuramoyl-L-alanine amidase